MSPRALLPVLALVAGCPAAGEDSHPNTDRDQDGILKRYDCDDRDPDVGIAPEGEECAGEEGDTA